MVKELIKQSDIMTLQECKEEVAKKYWEKDQFMLHQKWDKMHLVIKMSLMNEVADLYSQQKAKEAWSL